jgi:hypothetical protein
MHYISAIIVRKDADYHGVGEDSHGKEKSGSSHGLMLYCAICSHSKGQKYLDMRRSICKRNK